MRAIDASRLRAWSLAALGALVTAAYVAAVVLSLARDLAVDVGAETGLEPVYGISWLAYTWVGVFVAIRRPENPVGLAFVGIGLSQVAYSLSTEYAVRGLIESPGQLPFADAAAWVSFNAGLYVLVFMPLAFLWFPTGRPPTPRWRWVSWVAAAGAIALTAGALVSWPHRGVGMVTGNEPAALDESIWGSGTLAALMALTGLVVVAAVSLLVRYWRSAGREREQLKWLVFAISLVLVIVGAEGVGLLGGEGEPGWVTALVTLPWTAIPVAVGVAILRHGLFDIDRIVSRTLSYAVVTAVLVSVYAAGVLGIGRLLPSGSNDLLVAGSTLAVAALFQPVRRQVQGAVDRRFSRARYDAQVEVTAFGARLRDEVDLQHLSQELTQVTERTLRPTSVSLWLRTAPEVGHP